ncbi:MAG TPA: ornithine cyclodeaminase family protein [Anaerolineales bacterium]
MDYQILTDQDIHRLLDMKAVVDIIEESFRQKSAGSFSSPPRILVEGSKGGMMFTVGTSPNQEQGMGFRVYSVFNNATVKDNQLVAVFDSENGAFKGVVIGTAIGKLRTGAIGGVAVKYLSREESKTLGIIGTGQQAVTQLQAAVLVRDFDNIFVYSRDKDNREKFAQKMFAELDRDIIATDSVKDVVKQADVLICATISKEPVFDPNWLEPGTHVTTIGPYRPNNHELPLDVAPQSDLISTDSVEQIADLGEKYFLYDHIPLRQFVSLADIVTGKQPGRTSDQQRTLFCSIGLAGTEVAVAAHAFALNKK